jgi:hypothetical protein
MQPARKIVNPGKINARQLMSDQVHQPISPAPKTKVSLFPNDLKRSFNKSGVMIKQSPFRREFNGGGY